MGTLKDVASKARQLIAPSAADKLKGAQQQLAEVEAKVGRIEAAHASRAGHLQLELDELVNDEDAYAAKSAELTAHTSAPMPELERLQKLRERVEAELPALEHAARVERFAASAREAAAARAAVAADTDRLIAAERAAREAIDTARQRAEKAVERADALFAEVRELASVLGESVPTLVRWSPAVLSTAQHRIAAHQDALAAHEARGRDLRPSATMSRAVIEQVVADERHSLVRTHLIDLLGLYGFGAGLDHALAAAGYSHDAQLADLQADPERYVARRDQLQRDATERSAQLRKQAEIDDVRERLQQHAERMAKQSPSRDFDLRTVAEDCKLLDVAEALGVLPAAS